MPRTRSPLALLACALVLPAAAWAQSAPNLPESPASTPAPAAVPDAPLGAERPREGGSVLPIPTWRDYNGQLVSTQGNKLSEPERMNAGKPYTPLPWGSVVANVPGMNAGPSVRPLMPGAIVNAQPRMGAGKAPTTLAEGVRPGETAHMQAGPGTRPLPVGATPADIVAGGNAAARPAETSMVPGAGLPGQVTPGTTTPPTN
ncbi:hypothetical protein [Paracraurococcus ruber]|uniref:Uncharacterized protein n=1 Tax=Paracraurococcus ruber TaxID=77675 RepID=A0ABS1CXM7_9PROT|nr:hypothetical protein [Paracraurococcus ruber]MBK1658474.1 hypothetical protein [Paracraurococcus ruber]TDG31224.1 hypothetical protein E2C05_11785 [Paracraurococcus ruber]